METKQCFGKIILMAVKGLCGKSIARSVFTLALASRRGGEAGESQDGGCAEKSLGKPL